jgi:hypothetical protein
VAEKACTYSSRQRKPNQQASRRAEPTAVQSVITCLPITRMKSFPPDKKIPARTVSAPGLRGVLDGRLGHGGHPAITKKCAAPRLSSSSGTAMRSGLEAGPRGRGGGRCSRRAGRGAQRRPSNSRHCSRGADPDVQRHAPELFVLVTVVSGSGTPCRTPPNPRAQLNDLMNPWGCACSVRLRWRHVTRCYRNVAFRGNLRH